MASKRVASSPTGLTPKAKQAPPKRIDKSKEKQGKKRLSFGVGTSWSIEEEASLVEYVINNGFVDHWPASKKPQLWEGASKFVSSQSGHPPRTSKQSSQLRH